MADNIYVADSGNYAIREVTTTAVYTLAGTGIAGTVDGSQTIAEFSNPTGVIFISSGLWAVIDNNNIRKITG